MPEFTVLTMDNPGIYFFTNAFSNVNENILTLFPIHQSELLKFKWDKQIFLFNFKCNADLQFFLLFLRK